MWSRRGKDLTDRLAYVATAPALTAAWGSGPSDVWAVGEGGTILHWNGSAWADASSGNSSLYFRGVWGSGRNDVWAVGDKGAVLHWDGSAWAAVASGTTSNFYGVWGSGPNDVWAVGSHSAILHY